jgi:hypothetical protein
MGDYGIHINTSGAASARYRTDGGQTSEWELAEAEALAYPLVEVFSTATFITVGNGDHDFRMWGKDVAEYGNFDHPDLRWAPFYVDVQINGHRWRYRPAADLDSWDEAEQIGDEGAKLPEVEVMWIGKSDGSHEFEYLVNGD